MRTLIRDVPDLHAALGVLADQMIRVAAPDVDGQCRHWLPCDSANPHCCNVVSVPTNVVSTTCEDCLQPCSHADCGLKVHEHYDPLTFERRPCELIRTEVPA